MFEEKTIIDKDGFIVVDKVLFKDGKLLFYYLKDAEIIVDYCNRTLVKGKLENNKWIETATEEEIQVYNKSLYPFNSTE